AARRALREPRLVSLSRLAGHGQEVSIIGLVVALEHHVEVRPTARNGNSFDRVMRPLRPPFPAVRVTCAADELGQLGCILRLPDALRQQLRWRRLVRLLFPREDPSTHRAELLLELANHCEEVVRVGDHPRSPLLVVLRAPGNALRLEVEVGPTKSHNGTATPANRLQQRQTELRAHPRQVASMIAIRARDSGGKGHVQSQGTMSATTPISEVGEKAMIREFIKPFFNAANDPGGVGDDCAMISLGGQIVLASTDRVPADLTAFRLGILDHDGLGEYLARLNLSDIAACGGSPLALLLNLGLPETLSFDAVKQICSGVARQAGKFGCKVLGGDITSAVELSISATAIGIVAEGAQLTRSGARPGDTIFLSRPPGLTPAAFAYFLSKTQCEMTAEDVAVLRAQFTSIEPMVTLGMALAASGVCTSCMDNTDGVGQSLTELAEASAVSFVVDRDGMRVHEVVYRTAEATGATVHALLFNGGADFSLIGTLH